MRQERKEKLKTLIRAILKTAGRLPEVRLSQLVLLCEIEHYRKHGRSYTGLYFLKEGKQVYPGFFSEVLEEEAGKTIAVEKEYLLRGVYRHVYSLAVEDSPPQEVESVVRSVLERYRDDHALSGYVHNLPAVKYSTWEDILGFPELAIEDEGRFWAFVDILEDIEEEEEKELEFLNLYDKQFFSYLGM